MALVLTLVGLMNRSRAKFGDTDEFLPTALTGAQVYSDPDGYKHFSLLLEHGLPIPLVIDEQSARGLQAVLQEVIASGKLRSTPKLN